MRPLAAPFLVAVLLLPTAFAHTQAGDAQTHLTIRRVPLQPGANASYSIETGEGPWLAGMVFVLYLQFNSPARNVNVQLVFAETEIVANWTLEDGVRHKVSARIPLDDGPYELRFRNLADEATSFDYFFDQNCNCTYKPVPLDESWVVFGYDLRKGHEYRIGFPLLESWTVEGVLATLRSDRASYPDDFDVLDNLTASGPNWLNFTVKPAASGTYYLFLTAHEGSPSQPDPMKFVGLTPLLEETKGKSPGPGALLAALGLLAAAIGARRR
jgi:hypothetical protein